MRQSWGKLFTYFSYLGSGYDSLRLLNKSIAIDCAASFICYMASFCSSLCFCLLLGRNRHLNLYKAADQPYRLGTRVVCTVLLCGVTSRFPCWRPY